MTVQHSASPDEPTGSHRGQLKDRAAAHDAEPLRWLTGAELGELIGCTKDSLRLHRRRGWVVGVTVGAGRLYPAFQVDAASRRINPKIAAVNRALTNDFTEQQVVAWWVSRAGRSALAEIRAADA